jgi:hypothetical protein
MSRSRECESAGDAAGGFQLHGMQHRSRRCPGPAWSALLRRGDGGFHGEPGLRGGRSFCNAPVVAQRRKRAIVERLGLRLTGADVRGPGLRGPTAMAPVAIGALAIGAVAVGRLAIGRASIKRLTIEELEVTRLKVTELELAGEQRASV